MINPQEFLKKSGIPIQKNPRNYQNPWDFNMKKIPKKIVKKNEKSQKKTVRNGIIPLTRRLHCSLTMGIPLVAFLDKTLLGYYLRKVVIHFLFSFASDFV